MDSKALLYIDIETCSQYKDFESFMSIDTYGAGLFEKKNTRAGWGFVAESYVKKAGLIPEFGKIVCVSIGRFYEEKFKTISYTGSEQEILTTLRFTLIKAHKKNMKLCGFNIKGFDIPWLNKKYYQHGMVIPLIIVTKDKKPWELSHIIDLSEIWKSTGHELSTMDEMAYSMGIKRFDLIGGDQVHETFWNGNLTEIMKRCESDIETCFNIAEKMFSYQV